MYVSSICKQDQTNAKEECACLRSLLWIHVAKQMGVCVDFKYAHLVCGKSTAAAMHLSTFHLNKYGTIVKDGRK